MRSGAPSHSPHLPHAWVRCGTASSERSDSTRSIRRDTHQTRVWPSGQTPAPEPPRWHGSMRALACSHHLAPPPPPAADPSPRTIGSLVKNLVARLRDHTNLQSLVSKRVQPRCGASSFAEEELVAFEKEEGAMGRSTRAWGRVLAAAGVASPDDDMILTQLRVLQTKGGGYRESLHSEVIWEPESALRALCRGPEYLQSLWRPQSELHSVCAGQRGEPLPEVPSHCFP